MKIYTRINLRQLALSALLLTPLSVLADSNVCQNLWKTHNTAYSSYVSSSEVSKLQDLAKLLEKSRGEHEAWLTKAAARIMANEDIKSRVMQSQDETHGLRKKFDKLNDSKKSVLFSSSKRYQHLKEARSKDELFEESLTQEYFGVRSNARPENKDVFQYISATEDFNYDVVQPLYKSIKSSLRASTSQKIWVDQNGMTQEATVNHYRHNGQFVISVCSFVDSEKEFVGLTDYESLPPQFACTRLNLATNEIEKGNQNMEQIKSPELFQAFLTEQYFETHNIDQDQCVTYFVESFGKKKTLNAMR